MTTEPYREALESALAHVTAELGSIAHHDTHTDDWVATPDADNIGNADENVSADTIENWNERRALMAQLETRYRNIKRALQKIEAGTYGICEISGEPIEAGRLAANPAARTNLANMDREKELSI